MNARRVERWLWAAAFVFAVAAVVSWRTATPAMASHAVVRVPEAADIRGFSRDGLLAAAQAVTETNPFRLDRKPSVVAYAGNAMDAATSQNFHMKPAKPVLSVSGIVGGPPWAAILEGVPGREGGVLVRSGDTLASLTVRAVGRDTVIIVGSDTTWKLTVRRAW